MIKLLKIFPYKVPPPFDNLAPDDRFCTFSTTRPIYAAAGMLPALASMHLASKSIYNIAADFIGGVAEGSRFGDIVQEDLVGISMANSDEL